MKLTQTFSLLVCTFACAPVLLAAEQPSETPQPAPEKYEPKRRVKFTLTETARDPFRPIGWTPTIVKASGPSQVVQVTKIDPTQYKVTAIVAGNPPVANINQRTYAEGDFIKMKGVPPDQRIRVARILDGQVILQRGQETAVITMEKGTLNQPKDEQLLQEDEE